MIERISLNSIKFFYYVARYQRVTLAAARLFVTQGAVSKQIRNLEVQLNVNLFLRQNNRLILTREGQQLFECCDHIFQQLDHCMHQLQVSGKEKNNLVLSCEPTLAMKWLIPRLNRFNAMQQDFGITLLTAGGDVNFHEQQIDLAIRRNDFKWQDHIHSAHIADEYMLAVSHPQGHNNTTFLISSSRPETWQVFSRKNPDFIDDDTYQQSTLEHFYLCIEVWAAASAQFTCWKKSCNITFWCRLLRCMQMVQAIIYCLNIHLNLMTESNSSDNGSASKCIRASRKFLTFFLKKSASEHLNNMV